jgi:hypothetical protein
MKNNHLIPRIVDRIKENKRIAHDRQNSHPGLIGLVADVWKFSEQCRQFSMRFTTEAAADRLRS